MSLTSRTHKVENASFSKDDPQRPGMAAPDMAHPGAVLLRAKASGAPLAPTDVMQLQSSIGNRATRQFLAGASPGKPPIQRRENKTGLPDGLKAGVESISGMSLDDVSVHFNSDKPAQARARAYTQGSEIHVGPGQEGSLPHEAWHVVQQKQGRVAPTFQYKGIDINTDSTLETEADLMGAKAASLSSVAARLPSAGESLQSGQALGQTMQRKPVRQFGCFDPTPDDFADEDFDEVTLTHGGNHSKYDDVLAPSRLERAKLQGSDDQSVAEPLEVRDVDVAVNARKKLKHFGRTIHGKGSKIELATRKVQVYKIMDPTHEFYTAKASKNLRSIERSGLDPSRGGKRNLGDVDSVSDYMSRGHLYFCTEPDGCQIYADRFGLGEGNYVILKFTMPLGAEITVDPEWDGGFRTTEQIAPRNVQIHSRHEKRRRR